ncbi:GTP 3',8-cyclase MoaA [Paraferrimonas sedimenticola]|uniref:GTP 3',8-cyclase n=1 Tax=Paraferrimonas sedimenticola TaxID=375674 RepID=A0AA37RS65_9GAMM|nr:GTP 3',8-cyclase MoaA [Paraferrimonas sedimenticola]GLP95390.1 cyclic pyranopterin monophosphate synthase [Paraferrimonas sedimenticola]
MSHTLEDGFGRRFHYLRLSITDVCNFRCSYCLPDGYRPDGKPKFLNLDELTRVMQAFASLGTEKIRITGGEPTMRKDFVEVVRRAADTPGIKTIATTTNGYRLEKNAKAWYEAGLRQINVSVDSLDPRNFYQITGENKLEEVMRGIYAALDAGFERVKINAVLLKGLNDHQLPQFLQWIKPLPVDLRFIELMETGLGKDYFDKHHVSGAHYQALLQAQGWQLQPRHRSDGPALNYAHPDSKGRVGLIMPYSKDFCATCNRLRVSAKGQLHLCLFTEHGIDLRDLLQDDLQMPQLQQRLRNALQTKKATHELHSGLTGVRQHLASIGG